MHMVKKIIPFVFVVLIAALLVAPLGLIVRLSQAEQAEFATPSVPVLQEMAVGGIYQALTVTVGEFVTVSGTFDSETYDYMELDYEAVRDVRWAVSSGDEIQVGQVIGVGAQGEVVSEMDGIITQMHISADDCYIKLRLFTPVELRCRVDSRTLGILTRSRNLECGDVAVKLTFASRQQNADGTTDVRLSFDTNQYTYGEVATLSVSTGRQFDGVISLPARCVYQKYSGGDWYARQVTKDGIFVEEVKVEVIYSDSYNVYIKGVQEGEYFDSGYQIVAGG